MKKYINLHNMVKKNYLNLKQVCPIKGEEKKVICKTLTFYQGVFFLRAARSNWGIWMI